MSEEADIILEQNLMFIYITESRIAFIIDDTAGFAFLVYHYSHQSLHCPMIMQSPMIWSNINQKHGQLSSQILPLYVISDCDTIASTLGDQITAISVTHL